MGTKLLLRSLTTALGVALLAMLFGNPVAVEAAGSVGRYPVVATTVSGLITSNTTWTLAGSPYQVTDHLTIAAGATLNIEPGVQVVFSQYRGMWVDGVLNASGTASAPIIFTGSSSQLEWWRGLQVRGAGAATLDHVQITYSGYWDTVGLLKSGSGTLTVANTTIEQTKGDGLRVASNSGDVSLNSVTLANNSSVGLRLAGAGTVTGQNCSFRDNGQYGILQDVQDSFGYTGNSFSGNGLAGVGLNGGTRSSDQLLSPAGNPFRVVGHLTLAAGATMTVEPGTRLLFNQYIGMWVEGTLHAVGREDAAIVFTGSSESSGWWRGLQVQSGGSATFDHVEVGYSGYWESVGLLKSGSGALQVSNSSFHHTTGDGMRLVAGSSSQNLANNSFHHNNYGVRVGVNASFDDDGATFADNNVAVFLDGGDITGLVTWNLNPDYALYVGDHVTVGASGRLDILAGTVVKFAQYRGLWVDGVLDARGTTAEPIVFTDWRDDSQGGDANQDGTATTPAAGWWRGLQLRNAGAATLDYVQIAYSGYWDGVGLLKSGSGDLMLTNSSLHQNGGDGLRVSASSGMLTISRNSFSANATGVRVVDQAQSLILSNNLIEGNTSFGVNNQSSVELDARANWWGHGSGPANATLNPTGQGDAVSLNVRISPWFTQLPIYTWAQPQQSWFHGTEVLTWAALGEGRGGTSSEAASVDVQLTAADGTQSILGSSLPIESSLNWDTSQVADGWFDLRAVFRDASGTILSEATRHVLVNNAVTWHGGTLSGDERWEASSVHLVEANITIPVSMTLRLAPGVIVKFAPNTGIILQSGARLDAPAATASAGAPAAADDPILLTSLKDDSVGGDTNLDGNSSLPQPGDWSGLIVQGDGQANLGEQVEFRYIQVAHSGTITGSETWSPLFLHRISGDVSVPSGATLTIQPGAMVKFAPQARLIVASGATLVAEGTQAQPIVFTALTDDSVGGDTNQDGSLSIPLPGYWRDLNIEGQARLDHVVVRYGGGSSSGSWSSSGSLRTGGSSSVTMRNCRVEDGFFDGILAQGGELTVTNCVVTGHDRGLVAWLSGATVHVVNSTFDDNRIGVLAHGGALDITNSIISNSAQVCVERDIDPAPTVRFSNFWCPDALAVRGFTTPVGANGNISADPRYANRDLSNYRLRFGSAVVDAADGSVSPPFDIAGAPRYDDPRTSNSGTPTAGGSYADMGAYELVEDAPSDVDLFVSAIDGPQQVATGDTVTLSWTVVNSGTVAVRGPWHERIMLVMNPDSRPQLTEVAQPLVGQDTVLGPGQQVSFSVEVVVPPALPGNHVWQVTTNAQGDIFEGVNSANNTTQSPVPVLLDLPVLTVDSAPLTGQFSAASSAFSYQVRVPANQDVQVQLALNGGSGSGLLFELYAAEGRLPTTTSYDQRSDPRATTSPQITLAGSGADRAYYILAYAKGLQGSPVAFTLRAQTVTFQVQQVTPAEGGNAGTVTLAVSGAAFPDGSSVRLRLADGSTIAAQQLFQSGRTRIDATFDLRGRTPGAAAVEVVSPTSVVQSLADGFTILSGGSAEFWVELVGPNTLRAGRESLFELRWGNRGTLDAAVHLLDVAVPTNGELRLEPGGEAQVGRLFLLTALPDGAGLTVPPGYSASRPLYVTATSGGQITLNFGAVAIDDPSLATQVIDWSTIAPLARPAAMSEARWTALWSQLTTRLGGNWGTMLPVLAEHALTINRSERGQPELGVNLRTALLWELDEVLGVIGETGLGASGMAYPAVVLDQSTGSSTTHYLGIFLQDYDNNWWWSTDDLPAVGEDRRHVTTYVDQQAQIPASRRREIFDSTATTSDDVNTQQIMDEIRAIATRARAGDTIFIHYSGHGLTNGMSTRDSSIAWGELYNALNGSQAGRIVIVMDSCHSGGFVNWLKWIETSNTPYARPTAGRWNVVAAASEDQVSMDGWFSQPFYESLGKGQNYWDAFQDNANMTDWRGTTAQNPDIYSSDARFSVRDTDGSVKDGTDDGLGEDDPSPPGGSGSTSAGIVGSVDPNEKQTVGYGADGFVQDDTTLTYTIFFENDPAHGATAPVQELVITDTLSADLDWTTFELSEIGFGAEVIPVPTGHQNYQTSVMIAGSPYPVQIEAGLDPVSGELRWYFASRDVTTQDLPDDPLAGFLPVNDATGKGEGYVSFRIRMRTGLADGAVIHNLATITFDPTYGVNPPIVTNQVTNTLDLTAPGSAVQPLSATSSEQFTVTWAGSDTGAGVDYYDVYVSVDGAAFSLWKTHTADNSALFTGVEGSSYRFYSVATDHVGHHELKTAQAEATTRVVASGSLVYLPLVVR